MGRNGLRWTTITMKDVIMIDFHGVSLRRRFARAMPCHGLPWQGMTSHGKAWQGKAWQGIAEAEEGLVLGWRRASFLCRRLGEAEVKPKTRSGLQLL